MGDIKYVDDIPVTQRLELCETLDSTDSWRRLAGLIGFTAEQLNRLGRAYQRPHGSPTEDLLNDWSHKNPTVTDLFGHLTTMLCVDGLNILRPLVPKEIYESAMKKLDIDPDEW